MRSVVLFAAFIACHGKDPVDTDTDLTPPVSLRQGDVCDPADDRCSDDTVCCTACCRPDATPVCTAPDTFGTCPLPDITVDAARLAGAVDLQDIYVPEDDCTIAEGCVGGPGWRRVLKFATTTPNRGTANLHFGTPGDSDLFEYSECHEHYHFTTYAEYRLLASDGATVATGRKQAFCLMDFEPDPSVTDRGPKIYNCAFQGISVGWQDTYDSYLDCQWIDVTDVAAGDYTLEVELNTEQLIPEVDYGDDVAEVPFTLLAPGAEPPVTTPCETEASGAFRNCGWEIAAHETCTPGAAMHTFCNTCSGDPVMRICDADDGCRGIDALVNNDDGDRTSCSTAEFLCPDDGTFTVLTASWSAPGTAECDVTTVEN